MIYLYEWECVCVCVCVCVCARARARACVRVVIQSLNSPCSFFYFLCISFLNTIIIIIITSIIIIMNRLIDWIIWVNLYVIRLTKWHNQLKGREREEERGEASGRWKRRDTGGKEERIEEKDELEGRREEVDDIPQVWRVYDA